MSFPTACHSGSVRSYTHHLSIGRFASLTRSSLFASVRSHSYLKKLPVLSYFYPLNKTNVRYLFSYKWSYKKPVSLKIAEKQRKTVWRATRNYLAIRPLCLSASSSQSGSVEFHQILWKDINTSIYPNIIKHPFISELEAGTLAPEIFAGYMQQDYLYLQELVITFDKLLERSKNNKRIHAFFEYAQKATKREQAFCLRYLNEHQIPLTEEKSSICERYIDFLRSLAETADLSENIAALIPCFWLYQKVGRYLYEKASKDNRYLDWIKAYGEKEFSRSVQESIQLINEVATAAGEQQRKKMRETFHTAAAYDRSFWDSAYIFSSSKYI